jgi:hypothetical protein
VSYLRSAHERQAYRRIFYRDTEVYINKLGIRDQKLLDETERTLTERRATEGFPRRAHHRRNAITRQGAAQFPLPCRNTLPHGWRLYSNNLPVTGTWLAEASEISRRKPQGMSMRSTPVTPSSTGTEERSVFGSACWPTMRALILTSIRAPQSVGTTLPA